MATQAQMIKFFKIWNQAKSAVCAEFGLDPHDAKACEEARHRWIKRITNHNSIKDVGVIEPFDRLMAQTAAMAEDYAAASHFAAASENRIRHLTEQCLRQIGELLGLALPWEYVRGIYKHIGWPTDWKDIPAKELLDVFMMLDTHRRRILRNEYGQREDVKFDPDMAYARCTIVQPPASSEFETSDSSKKEVLCRH